MVRKSAEDGEGENEAERREKNPFNYEVVESHGLNFLKSDLEALEETDRERIVIDGNEIGFQFNQNSMGERWATRTIREDERTGKKYVFFKGLFLQVRDAGVTPGYETSDEMELGYYRAIDQVGGVKIDGEFVKALPHAEDFFDLRRDIRGPTDYVVITLRPDNNIGPYMRSLYSGLDGAKAAEELAKARDRDQEAYIVREDRLPKKRVQREMDVEDWRQFVQGGA